MSTQPTIEDFAWLSGTWRGEMAEDVVEEIWTEPRGRCLAGVFRWIQSEAIHIYEILAIEEEDGGIVLRIVHFDPGLVAWPSEADGPKTWRLVSLDGRRATFENPAVPFPRRIIYERLDDRTLLGTLEGEKASGAAELEFRFTLQGPSGN